MEYKDNIKQKGLQITGYGRVQLFNAETGEVELDVEKHNLAIDISKQLTSVAFNAILAMCSGLNTYTDFQEFSGIASDSYDAVSVLGLFDTLYLSPNTEEPVENEPVYKSGPRLAVAGSDYPYAGANTKRGTINVSESLLDIENNRVRLVFDFPTSVANGTFQSLGFANTKKRSAQSIYVPALDSQLTSDRLVALTCPSAMDEELDFSILPAVIPMASYLFASAIVLLVSVMVQIGNKVIATRRSSSGANFLELYLDTLTVGTTRYLHSMANRPMSGMPYMNNGILEMVGKEQAYDNFYLLTFGDPALLNIASNKIAETQVTLSLSEFNGIIIYGLREDANKLWIFCEATSNDPVLGVPRNRILYEYNLTSNTITDRIDLGESVGTVYGLWVETVDENILKLTSLDEPNFQWKIRYVDRSAGTGDNVLYNGTFASRDMSSQYSYRGMFETKSGRKGMTHSYSRTSSYQPYIYGRVRGKVRPFMLADNSVLTRVLLPAPVTKVNTQTMKVTYDLLFPPEIFGQ